MQRTLVILITQRNGQKINGPVNFVRFKIENTTYVNRNINCNLELLCKNKKKIGSKVYNHFVIKLNMISSEHRFPYSSPIH
jgi:hypothetical protein